MAAPAPPPAAADAADQVVYDWDAMREHTRTRGPQRNKIHNDALKWFRYCSEDPAGVPSCGPEGYAIDLKSDDHEILIAHRNEKGPDFWYDDACERQPWSWRGLFVSIRTAPTEFFSAGGVVALRFAYNPNTTDHNLKKNFPLKYQGVNPPVWDFIATMADQSEWKVHPRSRGGVDLAPYDPGFVGPVPDAGPGLSDGPGTYRRITSAHYEVSAPMWYQEGHDPVRDAHRAAHLARQREHQGEGPAAAVAAPSPPAPAAAPAAAPSAGATPSVVPPRFPKPDPPKPPPSAAPAKGPLIPAKAAPADYPEGAALGADDAAMPAKAAPAVAGPPPAQAPRRAHFADGPADDMVAKAPPAHFAAPPAKAPPALKAARAKAAESPAHDDGLRGCGEDAQAASQATPVLNQCPDAWARRHSKRAEAIAAVKRSHEYQAFSSSSQEFQDDCRLRLSMIDEPDPSDRSISKRSWERAVQVWRFDLRLAAWGIM